MLNSVIYNTSEICFAYGVRFVVLSPGSRNAPLILSFARHEKIKKFIIPDERSAGYVAIGVAQKAKSPVALCCTSGSALLNYAPATAEAFYREIPLVILSADRPPELIDQRDGQTIRQYESLRNHVKLSARLPLVSDTVSEGEYVAQLEKALMAVHQLPKGPIHINIPFKEPFYPTREQKLNFIEVTPPPLHSPEAESIPSIDLSGRKVLVVIGQMDFCKTMHHALEKIASWVPVLSTPVSNLQVEAVEHIDLFLENQEKLQADVLITTGLSVLSKRLRSYLRAHSPFIHIHFDPAGVKVDTYRSSPQVVKNTLAEFIKVTDFSVVNPYFRSHWMALSYKTRSAVNDYNSKFFCELMAFKMVLKGIPGQSDLHLANSMPIRYGEIIGIPKNVEVWSNRGTSGIDGCSSAAVGSSLVSKKLTVLITGDVAFLYDRNAFFHAHSYNNLRVIVSNNQGGGIFRLIDGGPSHLKELGTYFETRHHRSVKYICEENKMEYREAHSYEELARSLDGFFHPSRGARLLEFFTDPDTNEQAFKDFKEYIHERLNS